ncbi:MAG: hypothetical protein H6Q31_960 [Bacteroidetes bacterium]|nr:hypothetical protein [Bacteroidota bacterium]
MMKITMRTWYIGTPRYCRPFLPGGASMRCLWETMHGGGGGADPDGLRSEVWGLKGLASQRARVSEGSCLKGLASQRARVSEGWRPEGWRLRGLVSQRAGVSKCKSPPVRGNPWQADLCGAEGDRTPDLVNAIHALSQLSYSPKSRWYRNQDTETFLKCQSHNFQRE